MSELTVIVLAAGQGKRMKSSLPKVLHPLGGRTMVGHVLTAVEALGADRVVAVVGHGREQVTAHLHEHFPGVQVAVQEEQLGTGHATRVGLEAAGTVGGDVLVLTADTPLLTGETLVWFMERHRGGGRAVSILTADVPDPRGYGRIVRDGDDVRAIVEEKDASAQEQAITEINSGILAFDAAFLAAALPRLGNANASGEYYLTEAARLAAEDGLRAGAFLLEDRLQTEGANDRVQLAALGKELNRRIVERWMREGVTVVDPDTTWIHVDVEIGQDTTIEPGVQLLGVTSIGRGARIGPDSTLTDCEVGDGAHVVRTQALLSVIGEGADVGPFAHLRAGTVLGRTGKIGGFVETKNARIGDGAKVPHLSYVGDATIGEGSNIGAGTIFANYDGVAKHHTTIGAQVKSGSNVTFVAPVTVGDGAGTGAGTLVREDVPPGAMALSAGPQRLLEGWAQERRAGTAQAAAAEAARAAGVLVVGRPDAAGTPDEHPGEQSGDHEASHTGGPEVGAADPGRSES
ncbi:bifunctional UDP-N-acetylglucosamine diphosphorylase/glucosamine-1-phosphate N-acetyltransferase GlmU [Nocardioides sp.]|jgi:bifunctional UDP-N-acetylglucosamine pyrophosphorylase/glucosamine-1-phosphate N-acetyltransferase|uniref:bifunctional UDP-N-acetylglucosamine diphosphorylase/glucosamine-1-phosphate N-acetyltransferase GlmU n=1 Tax=Nocardioides sp. TaxID=35761 RepID=UPI002BBF2BB1|nr:bifunctional UDP-N-acetylglucosamine diphosphorylase/glucosamine-1-phosphate N-acetyltransferase GlmU [Nocardioides sp.]HVX55463.1 bifunctional UDP-N-acetylglucosamine diphosphorylase/glucosamine-1-phosphate N-acetyltransferase GlmU [Nocardioides sp.]